MGDRHCHGACVPALPHTFTARHECQPEVIIKKRKNTTARWSTDAGSLLQCTMTSRSRMRPHIQMCPTIAGAPKRPHNTRPTIIMYNYTRDTRTAEHGEPRKCIRTYAPLRTSTFVQTSQYNTCSALCS